MLYTFNNPDAESEKHIQYYEVHGNRGIYKDGWKAVVNHCFTEDYAKDEWELYHVEEDYSEKYNVADKYPEKLRELQEDFMHEAGKYGVFPMLRFSMHGKPENLSRQYAEKLPVSEKEFVFEHVRKPVDLVNERSIGGTNANQLVTAYIHRENEEDDGVIYSRGQRFGGFTFYIKNNRLKYVYNTNKVAYYEVVSDVEVPTGDVKVAYSYIIEGEKAKVTLYINDNEAGYGYVESFAYMMGFTTTLKANHYTPVTPDYEVPFEFKGRLDKVILHQYATEIDPKEELQKISSIE
jgi:arylsulfatase